MKENIEKGVLMGKRILIDITGNRYGKLVVIKRAENRVQPNGNVVAQWLCRCDCGNKKVIASAGLRYGKVKSCGCLWKKHGYSGERLYHIWVNMKQRCYNQHSKDYKNYGLLNVRVCDEWLHDYLLFRKWAYSHGYEDDLTIDRINVYGNYEPDNCRWITNAEQQKNRRKKP